MFAPMTLSEINRKYLRELQELYPRNESARITSIAFESIAGITRADVIKEPSKNISVEILNALEKALSRLRQHEPIQHITGEAWFFDLKLNVSPAVLVPRPETEELVSLASAFINENKHVALDIGTGSGCIAIALKKKHNNTSVIAIDVSAEALSLAIQNAHKHRCNILFKKVDFLDEAHWNEFEQVNVIISNPPYIPDSDKEILDKNVTLFEPHIALFEPFGQPFIFYKKIAKFGRTHLLPGGKIFVEIHEDFGKIVFEIFLNAGYEAELIKDMFGKERFVVAEGRFKV